MMTRDEVFVLIGNRLGQRDDTIPFMASEFNLMQSTVLEQHAWLPWFLLVDREDLTITDGATEVSLPVGFLRELDDEHSSVWLHQGDEYTQMAKLDTTGLLKWKAKSPDFAVGYLLGEGKLTFSAPLSSDYTVALSYYAADVVPAGNVENKWLKYASDLVIGELGYIIADKYLRDQVLAARFQQDASVAWDRLYRVHVARMEAARERIFGS